jgi:P-type Mg2+ transporter
MIPTEHELTPDSAPGVLLSRREGLRTDEARARLARVGPNELEDRKPHSALRTLASQLRSPLLLLLVGAAIIAAIAGEWIDTSVILAILFGSVCAGFVQDFRAERTVMRLRSGVQTRAAALRDGALVEIPARELVPGDVVQLAAGALVPADALLLEASDLFVNEAVLTGEPFPVEKRPGRHREGASLAERAGWVWAGTSVRSGAATAIVVLTGKRTEIGRVAHRLVLRSPDTDFERGLRRFGLLLARVVFVLVVAVFAANVLAARPPIASLLFAIALAVGITPEMLPAIVTITLAQGARAMAARGVVVKRLTAIESFGSMDVLCTDKTGTLTEGVVRLRGALAPDGEESERVRSLAAANAILHTGLRNALDEAIAACAVGELSEKIAELPYDFGRKRLSVIVADGQASRTIVTKGAFLPVFALCDTIRGEAGERALDATDRARIAARYEAWGIEGTRVLALGTRAVPAKDAYGVDEERNLCFEGFLLFEDTPKPSITNVVTDLARTGIQIKIVTGDNRQVALHVARMVGLPASGAVTGAELDRLTDDALPTVAARASVIAEVDPRQKERVVLAQERPCRRLHGRRDQRRARAPRCRRKHLRRGRGGRRARSRRRRAPPA